MSQPERSLSKFAAIFAGGTLFSRALGLIRDQVLNIFIPEGSREAFIVAFRFPNMLRDLVGEGASNAAFIPIFSETLEKKSKEEFRKVVASTMGGMMLVLGALSIIGVLLVPLLLQGLNALHPITNGEHLDAKTIALVTSLSQWTFPYLFWIGLAVLSMAALFTVHHYTTPSWAPALLNIAIIACVFAFRHMLPDPAYALVLGVWIGGVAQVAVQYYAMSRHVGVWRPSFQLRRPEIYAMIGLMIPVLFGQAAGEVNKLVDTLFAYKSAEGSVTALYNANRLVQLPLSIFGFAVASAVLPAASRYAARDDRAAVRSLLMQGMRQTYFMIAPATLGLMVIGEPIVRLLFEYRHFTAQDTEWTSIALAIYAAGLVTFAWVKVCVTGFFAFKDTKTPVLVSSGSMILNIVLNVGLVGPYGYKGLAVATSISYAANFIVLYLMLGQRFGLLWDRAFSGALLRMSISAIGMAAVAYAAYVRTYSFFAEDSWISRFCCVAVPVSIAVATYLLLSWYFGIPELRSFSRLVFRRR